MILASASPTTPLHGYRGEIDAQGRNTRPQGLTVCISREAGARGSSIARRVGQVLGWQVFDQETLGYLTQNESARADVLADLPASGLNWAEQRLAQYRDAIRQATSTDSHDLERLLFSLAARGEAVIVGRGAGALLPAESTLSVRIVAPLESRIAYMSQWLRMTTEEAAAEVAARDRVRAALHSALAHRDPQDATQYDLVLNSGRLGEAACAELIAEAVRGKVYRTDPFETPNELPVVEPV